MRLSILPLLGLLALAACGGGKTAAPTTTTTASTGAAGCTDVAMPTASARTEKKPSAALDPNKTYDVTLRTNCGSFTIRLDQAQSPNATASIVSLVEKGYFDHTVFHRIVPGFVIQGGDPTATGTGGPGYETVDTPPKSATYEHGVVAMAKTATEPRGTAGSQFFVVTAADAGLPPDYAIVGKVTAGLDVVDRIGKLGEVSTEQPTRVIEIQKATVSSS
jgi:cyclophilin family peptidyl-prolyl cis-trans isomerase